MKRRSREEPCSICGHYHDYEGGEPCATCGHRLLPAAGGAARPAAPSALPTELVPGLFVGSYDHASRAEMLRTLGVRAVCNTVPACPNLYRNTFEYHTASADPPPLDECADFVAAQLAAGGKVLVHCMAGGPRSAEVAAYCLMRATGCSAAQAAGLVAAKRPGAALRPEHAARLAAAEAALAARAAGGGAGAGAQQQQQQQQGQGQYSWGALPAPGGGVPRG